MSISLSILHLNAYDVHGGAERVAGDLIAEQRRAGHESLALVGYKTRADSPAIAFPTDPDLAHRLELQRAGWPDYEFRGSHRLTNHPAVQGADVIHAHNLYGGYFHPFSLIALSQFRPLIWTIHDMQAFTGYCSHSLDCERWTIGCGECPDLTLPGPKLPFDNTAALWRDKKLISDNSRLWLAAPSTWMAEKLERSLHGAHPIRLVPNGIATAIFRPSDRRAAREKLGLPRDALIVGSLARGGILAHPWKGGSHAQIVLRALRERHPDLLFLNIGASERGPEDWIRSRLTESTEALREMLSALDFFLAPSIADTAPLSVLEAMACGLPVVGFRTGGIPDFVSEAEGMLVAPNDTQSLTEAAARLAADGELRQHMGAAARARAVERFDVAQMAAGYEALYREAVSSHAGKRSSTNASAIAEIRRGQGELLEAERKLSELRARRTTEEAEIAGLLDHPWTRLGLRLGTLRGSVKKWLRRKERARRRTR